jgi:hypothetical protein
MSKIVRAATRVVGKVVNGVGKLAEKVTGSKTIGKLARVAAIAATVYFGGAAIAGMTSGAGAMAGIQGAWTSLGTAGNALMAGNFSGAGTALGSGFGGTAMTGTQLAASQAGAAATQAAGAAGFSGATSTGLPTVAGDVANVAASKGGGGGMLSKFMSNPYVAPSLVQAGAGMLSSVGQGKQMEAMQEREDEKEEDRRRRYNTNVGTRLWG